MPRAADPKEKYDFQEWAKDKIIFRMRSLVMSLSYFPTHVHLMLRHTAQCSYKGGGYDNTEILSKEKEVEIPFFLA